MRVILQRVTHASVSVENALVSEIGFGYLLLVGIGQGDTEETVKDMAETIARLRVISDDEGKMNRSVLDVKGEILVISQFTLYADMSRGRRPYFGNAAEPEKARGLLNSFVSALSDFGLIVKEGEFGAYMQVELVNDGPVTIVLE